MPHSNEYNKRVDFILNAINRFLRMDLFNFLKVNNSEQCLEPSQQKLQTLKQTISQLQQGIVDDIPINQDHNQHHINTSEAKIHGELAYVDELAICHCVVDCLIAIANTQQLFYEDKHCIAKEEQLSELESRFRVLLDTVNHNCQFDNVDCLMDWKNLVQIECFQQIVLFILFYDFMHVTQYDEALYNHLAQLIVTNDQVLDAGRPDLTDQEKVSAQRYQDFKPIVAYLHYLRTGKAVNGDDPFIWCEFKLQQMEIQRQNRTQADTGLVEHEQQQNREIGNNAVIPTYLKKYLQSRSLIHSVLIIINQPHRDKSSLSLLMALLQVDFSSEFGQPFDTQIMSELFKVFANHLFLQNILNVFRYPGYLALTERQTLAIDKLVSFYHKANPSQVPEAAVQDLLAQLDQTIGMAAARDNVFTDSASIEDSHCLKLIKQQVSPLLAIWDQRAAAYIDFVIHLYTTAVNNHANDQVWLNELADKARRLPDLQVQNVKNFFIANLNNIKRILNDYLQQGMSNLQQYYPVNPHTVNDGEVFQHIHCICQAIYIIDQFLETEQYRLIHKHYSYHRRAFLISETLPLLSDNERLVESLVKNERLPDILIGFHEAWVRDIDAIIRKNNEFKHCLNETAASVAAIYNSFLICFHESGQLNQSYMCGHFDKLDKCQDALNKELAELECSFERLGFCQNTLQAAGEYLVLSEVGQQVLLFFLALDTIQGRPFLSKQMGASIASHLYHAILDNDLKDVVDYFYYKRTSQQLNTYGYITRCELLLPDLGKANSKSDDWILLVLNKAYIKNESSVPLFLSKLVNQTLFVWACDQIMKNAADESERRVLFKKLGDKATLNFHGHISDDELTILESDYIANLGRTLTMTKDWFDMHCKLNFDNNVMETHYLIPQSLDLISRICRQLIVIQMNQRSPKHIKSKIHSLRGNLLDLWLRQLNGKVACFMRIDTYDKTDSTSLSDKEHAIITKVISPLVDLMYNNDQHNIVRLCDALHQAYEQFCAHDCLQFDISRYRLDKRMMSSFVRAMPDVADYCLQFIKTRLSALYEKLTCKSENNDQLQTFISIYNLCESVFAQEGLSLNIDDQVQVLRERLGGLEINDQVVAEFYDQDHCAHSNNQTTKPSKSKKKRDKRRRKKTVSQSVDQLAIDQFKDNTARLENDICVFLKQKLGSTLTMLDLSQLELDSRSMLTTTQNLISQGDSLFNNVDSGNVPEQYNMLALYNNFLQLLLQIAKLKQAYVRDEPDKITSQNQAVDDQIKTVASILQQYYEHNTHWHYLINSHAGQSIITFVMFCELFHTGEYFQDDLRYNLINELNASSAHDVIKTAIGYLAYQYDELKTPNPNNPIVQCERFLDNLQQSKLKESHHIATQLEQHLRAALINDKSPVPGYLRYVVNSQLLAHAILSIMSCYPAKHDSLPLFQKLCRVSRDIESAPVASYIQVSVNYLAQKASMMTVMNMLHDPSYVHNKFKFKHLHSVQFYFESNAWRKPGQFKEPFAKVIKELDNCYQVIQQTRQAYKDHALESSLVYEADQLLQTCVDPLLAVQHPQFLNIKHLISVLEAATQQTESDDDILSCVSAEDFKLPPDNKANPLFGIYLKNLARDWLEQLTPILNRIVDSCSHYMSDQVDEVYDRLSVLKSIKKLVELLSQSPQVSAQLARDSWVINQLVHDYQHYYDRLFDQQSSQQADCVSSAETASSTSTNNDTSNPALTIDNCLPDAVWQLAQDVQQFEREYGLKGWLVLTGGVVTALILGRAIDDDDDYDLVWLVPDEHKQDPQYYLRRLGQFFWRKEMGHYAAPAMPKSPYHPVLKIKTQGNSTCYFDISCELVEPRYDNNVVQDSERFRQALAECLLRRDIRICTMVVDLTHSSPDDKTLTVIDEVGASLDVQRKEITLIGGCSPDNIQVQLTDDPGRLIRMAKLKLKYADYGLKLNEDLAHNLSVVVTPQFWDCISTNHLSTAQGRLGTQLQKLMVSFSTHQVMQLLMEDEQLGGLLPKLAGVELSNECRRELTQIWPQYINNNVVCQADDQPEKSL